MKLGPYIKRARLSRARESTDWERLTLRRISGGIRRKIKGKTARIVKKFRHLATF